MAGKEFAMVDGKADAKNRTALDILVAGAGYVGLAAAVSLKQARSKASPSVPSTSTAPASPSILPTARR
ncbi:hypothetical protein [Mesorhizobium sp.]|uniref:hypothetical protein n=1 Tax=Mesorhizobium sp. TaxID=1871066 RepID=UPI0011F7D658|nr:hypothetical protein [Mesorhizobium sp.]TIL35826.1 MAG: hypothetical protein E5Y82_22760 [Mesorhizobium sp.]